MGKIVFDWTENEQRDDFTCRLNDFVLRVEQLEEKIWWWAVYTPDAQDELSSWTDSKWATTEEQAKFFAQNAYYTLNKQTVNL